MIAVLFAALGLVLIARAVQYGGPWWLLAWLGASLLAVSAGYFGLGSRVFGKSADGKRAWWSLVLLAPYLLFIRVVWELVTRAIREDCFNEVVPGVLLGRRPRDTEIPPGVGLLVDMTCEFPGPRCHGADTSYLCVPTLDTAVPDDESFRSAVNRVVNCSDPVFIFCAQGHGRSATLAAAVLISRGVAPDVETAEATLQRVRPGVRLSRSQRALVQRIANQR